ncbi:MAG: hypothetical protein GXP54_03720, partial [Deltaproteobacteria bacterium]|nr:hypothetical protein [Deltaproteobacteria bacterium]
MKRLVLVLTCAVWCGVLMCCALGCESREVDPGDPPFIRSQNGTLAVRILMPEQAGEGLRLAAADLVDALVGITGAVPPNDPSDLFLTDPTDTAGRPVVNVQVIPGVDINLGDQGYRFAFGRLGGGSPTLTITARNETSAMYGIYQVIQDMGVQYFHPEETYMPADNAATLPWDMDKAIHSPAFELRGFHEQTQHPIPASDFLLRPDMDGARGFASRYLKWLARNRQNVFTFQMLDTVDMDLWLPYIGSIVDEAHAYGIKVGLVIGFIDQQYNAYSLVRDDDAEPDDAQIAKRLDELLAAGFDLVVLRTGGDEFKRPDRDKALGRLDFTLSYLKDKHPAVRAYAWVPVSCGLEPDHDGTQT